MAEATEVETKFCRNCKRDISAANFVMHEMHCMRNITLCKHCKEPVPKGEIEQHFEELHAKIKCEKCGVDVEKSVLEKHEQEDCSKRPMKCTYCEIEIPRSDLDQHLDYCGTRTEACAKCGQFIMKKDEIRHEESKCTYPTPKPVTENTTSQSTTNNGQNTHILLPDQIYRSDPNYDPFVFEEMHRMLRSEDIAGAAGGIAHPFVNDTRQDKTKLTKSKTNNKKSEVNKQREKTNHRPEPVITSRNRESTKNVNQEEQDRLLAMHLAQDLNESDNIQDIIRQLDKPSLIARGGHTSPTFDRNMSDGFDIEPDHPDISFLPCEFCGEAFPLDDIVNHQSNCTSDPLSSLMPQINNREDPSWSSGGVAQETIPQELDNRLRSQDNARQQPSVINNLDYGALQNMWASGSANEDIHGFDIEDHHPDSGNFMLPCEFCDELFPQDVLVQHQAVCEPNSSMTPRPPVQRTPKKQNTEPTHISDRYKPSTNDILHSRSSNSRTSSSASRDDPPSHHLRETLHKYGVELKEPKIPSSRRYSGTLDSDEENHTSQRRASHTKRVEGASRTRHTLDELLQADQPHPKVNYLSHINNGSRQKQSKDNTNVSRQSGYVPSVSGARGDSKTTNASRNTRRDLELSGAALLDSRSNRNPNRPTGTTAASSNRTRNQLGSTPSRTTTETSQNRQGSRTRPFDYGTNKNPKPSNRRYPDQY